MRHVLITRVFTMLLAISAFMAVGTEQTTTEKNTVKSDRYVVKGGIIQGKLYLPANAGRAAKTYGAPLRCIRNEFGFQKFEVNKFQSLFLVYGLITNAKAFPGVR